jgi:hypothetical protein
MIRAREYQGGETKLDRFVRKFAGDMKTWGADEVKTAITRGLMDGSITIAELNALSASAQESKDKDPNK